MRQFFSNKKLIVILLSFIVSISLIAFSILTPGQTTPPQQVISDVTGVAQRGVSTPSNIIMDFYHSVKDVSNAYAENKELKSRLDHLYEVEAKLVNAEEEKASLQSLLEINEDLADYELVNGTVIARSPDGWNNQVIINLGSNSGVEVGMSVVSNSGLIGRVSEVNPTNSKVALLSSSSENAGRVAALIQTKDGSYNGVVNGYDSKTNELVINQLDSNGKVSEGDKVITSGLGGVTVSSLYIGQVTSVETDRFGLTQEIRVKPGGNFSDLRYVAVVISGNGEILEAQPAKVENRTSVDDQEKRKAEQEKNSSDPINNPQAQESGDVN